MNDKKRFFFESGESNYISLQVTAFEGSKTVNFSAEDEWCGDSEIGFGAIVSVEVAKQDAIMLISMLQEWVDS